MRFGSEPHPSPAPTSRPATTAPPLGRPLYEVEEAGILLHCGRTKVFELLKRGDLHGVRVGRRRLVAGRSLTDYLDRLAAG